MFLRLKEGLEYELQKNITSDMTALNWGSGEVNVLATPVLIGLMENAALNAVDPELPDGYVTVGFGVNIRHLAPSPVGMRVRVHARLEEIEGNKLTFRVWAFDEKEKIGEGTHIRYIVGVKELQQKASNKANS